MLREVLEALPGAHLTFVGDGPFRPDLEAHFAGCRVTFTVNSRDEVGHVAFQSLTMSGVALE